MRVHEHRACRRSYSARITAALITLAVPSATVAQAPPDPFRLDPLVVTATRWALPRSLAPAAVTVLHGDELRARGIRFVAEALRLVPGAHPVQTGSHGGLTSLFLRGGESDYVQVMIDGIVANDPGGSFDFAHLTTDNIERIEIVRGPVSVLYGSDAVTGVVHIITRSGRDGPRVDASAGIGHGLRTNGEPATCPGYPRTPCPDTDLGSYTTRALDASIAGAAGALDYAFAASHLETGGAYAFNNDYDSQSTSGRVQFQAGPRTRIAASARWTDGVFHFPTDGAGRLVDRNQHRTTESLLAGVDVAHSLDDLVDVRLTLSMHDGDAMTDDPVDGPADTLGTFQSLSTSHIERRKADLHADFRAGEAVITAGIEVESQAGSSRFASQGSFGPFESSSDHERTNRAAYAQVVAPAGAHLRLTAGGRAEDNDRFGTFLTWRWGANLNAGRGFFVRAAAGTGFKEPTFFENHAQGFVTGNPALEPEQSRSVEVGIEKELQSGRGRIGVTAFDQRFDHLIQFVASPAEPGAPNYVNLGRAKSAGLELEARAGTAAGVRIEGSWTLLDTEVLDAGTGQDRLFQQGEALIRRPANRWTLGTSAPIGSHTDVMLTLTRVGERDDLDFLDDFAGTRVTMPGFTTVSLTGRVRPFERGPALTIRIDNLLDDRYREIANFAATGRVIFVGIAAAR
ncbi:MAG: TonB-dependent receptor [Gemmatimonadetes bacterium]|nr:TonB-dependent receptor [Gemmatimonadota bacterium]